MADEQTMTIAQQVAVAKTGIENLTPRDLARESARAAVVIVDVREPVEAAAGVIPGAVLVPRGLLEFWADTRSPAHRPDLSPHRRLILYSATGARSALAVHALYSLGYRDVAHLDGGLAAWKADGRSVSVSEA